ncbi:atrial natriuretic peptide receptor 1-like protein, partial [Dinothrombium tinctorium]
QTKAIYESLLLVAVRIPQSDEYKSFIEEIAVRSTIQLRRKFDEDDINAIITGFHDSVLLYAKALNETIREGGDLKDGFSITRKLWKRSFYGYVSGDIHFNENGDQETDYTLSDFDPATMKMRTVFNFYGHRDESEALVKVGEISWPNGRNTPPPDIPECGFIGDKCLETDKSLRYFITTSLVLLCLVMITVVIMFIIYRKLKLESELASHWWRIRWDEINIIEGSDRSFDLRDEPSPNTSSAPRQNYFVSQQQKSMNTRENLLTVVEAANVYSKWPQETRKGIFKGMRVAVKPINIRRLSMNRNVLMELKYMKDICHENLIRFIGFCPDEPHLFIITEYAQKGNLRDLLDNEAFNIDWPFRFSLLSDIVEGMSFIHNSAIEFHGRLKSTNCVIDRRLVVKLTDYGLRSLINQSINDTHDLKSLLWIAPEFLRFKNPHHHGSQKGDVYSFAIVLQEIVTRTAPFETPSNRDGSNPSYNVSAIINRLKSGAKPYCRPTIPDSEAECPPVVRELMIDCWSEDPADRPTFETIKHTLKRATRDLGTGNFLENLLLRMEQYANDLEKLVENKTAAFFEEKRKCEEILYEVLPRYVVEQLKFGHPVRPESFECVTIFFSDVVDFPKLSSNSNPMQIIELLNDIYTVFDGIIVNYDVYKVETVGDAFMVVSGLPINNGDEHVREIARMSLELREEIKKFKIKHMPDETLQLRIGLHSGPCAAGVIGLKMPRYCLFGDTINTASRMETYGEAMKIHISSETKRLLQKFGTFEIELRGLIQIKVIQAKDWSKRIGYCEKKTAVSEHFCHSHEYRNCIRSFK